MYVLWFNGNMSQNTSDVHTDFALRRPQSRAEQLAQAIQESLSGMSPGDYYGTLEGIREKSGTARTTVSEAVKLLRDRGVLEIRPGRGGGLFVAHTTPVVRLRHTLMSVDEDPELVADAIELRETLEGLVASKAARHRTAHDLEDLEECLDGMRGADTWADFMQANWTLHRRIARICPNRMARAVYESTLGSLSSGRASSDDEVDESYRAARLHVHEMLVEAIAAGDENSVAEAVAAHASAGK